MKEYNYNKKYSINVLNFPLFQVSLPIPDLIRQNQFKGPAHIGIFPAFLVNDAMIQAGKMPYTFPSFSRCAFDFRPWMSGFALPLMVASQASTNTNSWPLSMRIYGIQHRCRRYEKKTIKRQNMGGSNPHRILAGTMAPNNHPLPLSLLYLGRTMVGILSYTEGNGVITINVDIRQRRKLQL